MDAFRVWPLTRFAILFLMANYLPVTFKSVFVLLAERSLMLALFLLSDMIVCGDKWIRIEIVLATLQSPVFVLSCIIPRFCGKPTYVR